jgi:hypothetical protein
VEEVLANHIVPWLQGGQKTQGLVLGVVRALSDCWSMPADESIVITDKMAECLSGLRTGFRALEACKSKGVGSVYDPEDLEAMLSVNDWDIETPQCWYRKVPVEERFLSQRWSRTGDLFQLRCFTMVWCPTLKL